ncbi:MAG: hypothetical protein H0U85_09185 [Gemmatimonadales bacterium]|nr:hypothetical protein [Gemmatimonadales bacterium]
MKYFHRTHLSPEQAVARATAFFASRLGPTEESPRRIAFAGAIGAVAITVEAEGGHYTRVTVATDQPGESEIDRLGRRFLTMLHTSAEPGHRPIGAY